MKDPQEVFWGDITRIFRIQMDTIGKFHGDPILSFTKMDY